MATKREYAISKGLAKPTRGRLSREAKAEIERARAQGMTFDDDPGVELDDSADAELIRANQPVVYAPLVSPPIIRDIDSIQGFTEEGFKVSSPYCSKCAYHVSRCPCRGGIHPTAVTVRWDDDSKKHGQPLESPSLA